MTRALGLPLALAALGTGCGEDAAYRLSWTVGGRAPGGDAAVCAAAGLSGVFVFTVEPESGRIESDDVFACRAGAGEVGGLGGGTYDLLVHGLGPDGRVRAGPVAVQAVELTEGETEEVAAVDLPPPDLCADGADNDRDGRVDQVDPSCDR